MDVFWNLFGISLFSPTLLSIWFADSKIDPSFHVISYFYIEVLTLSFAVPLSFFHWTLNWRLGYPYKVAIFENLFAWLIYGT